MVPDKFNMVDMGGIDLILMQGEEVSGLYNRLVESIAQCRYQCLYNWLFDGVIIPPTYVEMEVGLDEEVRINEGVVVTSDDVIHIYSIEPPAPEPEIIPLLAEENGTYDVPTGVDGFNPVTVDVPSYTPVVQSLNVTENGTYSAPSGVDGYTPVIVNVPGGGSTQFGYSDVTFTNTTTDSNIGDAQTDHITTALDSLAGAASGSEQVIYTTMPIDLTNVNFLIGKVYSASFNSNSSGGMYIGAAQSIPSSYSNALQSSNKIYIAGTYTNGIYTIDTSGLTGLYYLFYASKIGFSTSGYAKSNFELYTA